MLVQTKPFQANLIFLVSIDPSQEETLMVPLDVVSKDLTNRDQTSLKHWLTCTGGCVIKTFQLHNVLIP